MIKCRKQKIGILEKTIWDIHWKDTLEVIIQFKKTYLDVDQDRILNNIEQGIG